ALHEQMHAEAAAMMAQHVGIPLRESAAPPVVRTRDGVHVPAAAVRLGAAAHAFAFDNELGAHEVEIAAFTVDAEPVTWAAFLPFVEAGGYADPRWWSPQGRVWLAGQRRRQPQHLRATSQGWEQMRAGDWKPLEEDAVALHLCAHEADAWCRWAGRRLPTEAEWECAALTQPGFRWGHAWEWTSSRFAPYPGFVPHPYRDYSQPWFGSRRVLRGASPATAPVLAHARYRNFFEPHRTDVFAGFRSVHAPQGQPGFASVDAGV
ncbi:MAG TPA: SUMF1/EgtB/PvdO family nonheme iron enzyme, partial [Ramlibacter sp.]|nr:SUMF1/EgtB/PvdO family nonheme iron enzyme [Ramlibacter sp.]